MLHIPQKDIEWYKRRPGYYGMVQDNLKKLNDTLGDIDMTKDQEKTLVWLAGNDTRTIDNIIKVIEKWHILKENNRKREQPKEELMIKLWLQLWQFVLTVVLGMYTILYVESVVITEENWQSKKKLLFKLLSISMYGPKAI